MACGTVRLNLVILLGMWVTAGWRLCDKLGLLVFYSCSWGQLAVQDDLRGLTDSELRVGVVDTPILEPRQVIARKHEFRCTNRTGLGDFKNQPW